VTARVYTLGAPVSFRLEVQSRSLAALPGSSRRVFDPRTPVQVDPAEECEVNRLRSWCRFDFHFTGVVAGEYRPLCEVLFGTTDFYAGAGVAPVNGFRSMSASYISTMASYAGTLQLTNLNSLVSISDPCVLEIPALKSRLWVKLDPGQVQEWRLGCHSALEWSSVTDINRRSISV